MIDLTNVTKTYKRGGIVALDDVTFSIETGDFAFLIGPSGSGKSTLMRLLTAEDRADAGTLRVAGTDVTRIRRWKVPTLRRRVGFVFQDFKLLDTKTVFSNVAFALEVVGTPRKEAHKRINEVLELVGLSEKSEAFPRELSGGQQQRVAIARAVVNNPPVLLCDEPTGNLDPATSTDTVAALQRINEGGTTVLMATHDEQVVDRVRRRVIELKDGKLVRDQSRGVYGYRR